MFIGDIEKMDLDSLFVPSSFDVIMYGDLLEHLVSPEEVLKKTMKYLRPDGYLVVSLPNICHGDILLNMLMGNFHYTSMGLLDTTHLRFFGLKNIIDLFSGCGYSITAIHTTKAEIGSTEQRVDPDLVPKPLLTFVASLPNADVYQYVFKAVPSHHPEAATDLFEPDLHALFQGVIRDIIDAETHDLVEQMARLSTELDLKETHIANLDGIIESLRAESSAFELGMENLRDEVQSKEIHITNLDGIIESLRVESRAFELGMGNLRDEIRSKDTHITNLEGIIESLEIRKRADEAEMSILSENLKRKEAMIREQDQKIIHLSSTLSSIENSATWMAVTKFDSVMNRLLPHGTGRRRLYDRSLLGLRILIREGPRALWMRGKMKLPYSRRVSTRPVVRMQIEMYDGNVPLPLDTPLTGCFISPADQLHAIEFLTATYERRNADVTLTLREGDQQGSVIREATIKGSRIANNAYSRWVFKPIPDSKDKKYSFELVSKGLPTAAIWYNPDLLHEKQQLYRGGCEVHGQVGLCCYSKEVIRDPYDLWIMNHEPGIIQLDEMRDECSAFPYQPKISIITPVWNTDEKWLRQAIESVMDQVYQNWELCLADGGSTSPHVRRVIEEYADRDPRIRIAVLDKNKGISGNSNEALAMASGEWIGLLDHDDELAPYALYEVVKLLNSKRDAGFIYSDEDKIDGAGRRSSPFFKPDFAPDMFLSHNYICHFSVIRRDLIDHAGGFREGYDGSQDYDLFLRVTELLDEKEIVHIPKILYHWRIIPGSAADSIEAKPYAINAAKLALTDALRRRGIHGSVTDGLFYGSYRVRYEIDGDPLVSIIIPTKDKVDLLKVCVQSIIQKTQYQNYEIIIVDNLSREKEIFDYYRSLEGDNRFRIIEYNHPFNFSEMNNFAVSHAAGTHLVFLNNDIEIISDEWLSAMLEHSQRPEVGAVGAKLLYTNNTVQHAGIIIGIVGKPPVGGHAHRHLPGSHPGYFGRASHIADVSAVTAACLMMRRAVFSEVGGFDPKLAVAFNDVDLCLKIRQRGYRLIYTPYALLYHHESLSRGYEDTPEKQARFLHEVDCIRKRWREVLDAGDPYYNPNLTVEDNDFSIRI
jgi:GT2 family glycosyltransferase